MGKGPGPGGRVAATPAPCPCSCTRKSPFCAPGSHPRRVNVTHMQVYTTALAPGGSDGLPRMSFFFSIKKKKKMKRGSTGRYGAGPAPAERRGRLCGPHPASGTPCRPECAAALGTVRASEPSEGACRGVYGNEVVSVPPRKRFDRAACRDGGGGAPSESAEPGEERGPAEGCRGACSEMSGTDLRVSGGPLSGA